ncbi:MAG: response regulator transcription factor [Chloroflexi bacterium]|nr:response regulator transcription factor [Chloroflexota bacterium]
MKVLLVDDDRDLVELLAFALRRAGFEVVPAYDRRTALELLKAQGPDLVVLDVTVPPDSGFDILRDLRRHSQIPVIMVTARDSDDDKVRALEDGADDYVTKPFSHRELVARIRAHLRRYGEETARPAFPQNVLQVGPLSLNVAEHQVTKDGRPLDLTVVEFRLLHYLMINAGTVVTVRNVLRYVWGYHDPGGTDVARVTMYRLRHKVEDRASNPTLIHTVPGVGFILKAEPPTESGEPK